MAKWLLVTPDIMILDEPTRGIDVGASPSGGIGKVTGSLIGALVMASLTNDMNLMGLGSSFHNQYR